MIYVMSDLHGCFHEFKKALELIQFNKKDTLYILGDLIDRGNDSCKLLLEIMKYDNIIPLLGNHEYMALEIFEKTFVEVSDQVLEDYKEEDLMKYYDYIANGGNTTLKEFNQLTMVEKKKIVAYLRTFQPYKQITVNHRNYLLVHAGLYHYCKDQPIQEYTVEQLIFQSPSLNEYYGHDYYTIIGHIPNFKYKQEQIFAHHKIIHIDCGLVFGHCLGILCLDTLKSYYVKKQ